MHKCVVVYNVNTRSTAATSSLKSSLFLKCISHFYICKLSKTMFFTSHSNNFSTANKHIKLILDVEFPLLFIEKRYRDFPFLWNSGLCDLKILFPLSPMKFNICFLRAFLRFFHSSKTDGKEEFLK